MKNGIEAMERTMMQKPRRNESQPGTMEAKNWDELHLACSFSLILAQPPSAHVKMADRLAVIDGLGAEIRRLKELGGAAKDAVVVALVDEMNAHKEELAPSLLAEIAKLEGALEAALSRGEGADEIAAEATRLCNLLPPKEKKKAEKRLKQRRKNGEAAAARRFDKKKYTDGLRIQRKIHHLFECQGSGDTFVYFPDRLATALHGITGAPQRKQATAAHTL